MRSSTIVSFLFAAFVATATAASPRAQLRSTFQRRALELRDQQGYEDCCVECVENDAINDNPDALDNCFSECAASHLEDLEECDNKSEAESCVSECSSSASSSDDDDDDDDDENNGSSKFRARGILKTHKMKECVKDCIKDKC